VSTFNPLNAPDTILQAFIGNNDKFQEVIKLRNNKALNELSFYQSTGIDSDEGVSFIAGPTLKITIIAKSQNNKLSKHFIVNLHPRSLAKPVTILSTTWN
jgi:hypothetical protein